MKPHPRVHRHREFAFRGERGEAIQNILRDFIDRRWLEPRKFDSYFNTVFLLCLSCCLLLV